MFTETSEREITRAIVEEFSTNLLENLSPDVIVVGGGPSGLVAAREVALAGARTVLVECNNYLGGGFWVGGYLMSPVTIRAPGEEVLRELGVPLSEKTPGLYVADGPHACSKLAAAACEAGVRVLNMTRFDDLILREGERVGGVVVNWSAVSALPRQITCVDPIGVEAKIVIDATGHDACVTNALASRDLLSIKGMGCMWAEKAEEAIVEMTGEVHPGLLVTGMAVSTVYGLPRTGPTFGAMLLSGRKAGSLAVRMLKSLGGEIRAEAEEIKV